MNRARSPILALVMLIGLIAGCSSEPDRHPVVFIGIDGATWSIIDPMIEAGELPNFERLKQRGAWGPLLTVGPQVSPVVWTTFATGRFGRSHGILDFTYPYTPGPKKPVESGQRQSAAMWNIASDAGLSVDVVGYFASFPAETINGVMATDRIFQRIEGSLSPPDALDPISEDLDRYYNGDFQKTLWQRFLPWDYNPRPDDPEHPNYEADWMVAGRVDSNIVYSEYLRLITNYLLDEAQRDLFVTYFRTPDYVSHSLYWYFDDSDYAEKPDPHIQSLLEDVLPESYRFMDDVLGDILDRLPDDTNLVIVSDHGSGSATGVYEIRDESLKDKLTGNHRPDGIFLAVGPDIQPGRIDGLTIMEVFPAVMALLGLPLSDELPGRLDHRLFKDSLFERHPLTTVPQYAHTPGASTEVVADEAAQKDTVKALRGLGYVGEGFEYGDRDASDEGFWASEAALLNHHLEGEIVYWLLREDLEAALAVLETTRTHRPEVAAGLPAIVNGAFNALAERFPPEQIPSDLLENFLQQARDKRQPEAAP